MQIPQTVREVIEKGPLAHLTTLNPNGSPQVSRIELDTVGQVPGIDAVTFEQVAQAAKLAET
jgi:hypothetical protein